MPKYDLSAYKTIRLYLLLHELQTETEEPLVLWLHRIACAVDPFMKHGQRLKLRPDENWKVSRTREERIIVPVGDPHGSLARFAGMRDVTYWDPWEFDRSALIIFTEPPIDIREAPGLESRLKDEGIQIHRDDFRTWCQSAGYPLPRFWFPEEQRKHVPSSGKQSHSKKSLEAKLTELVIQLFWESPPPAGHNRPTKTQITDWLMEYAATDGLTEKAAARIFTSSRPEHIPKHGNLPHDKKPFPLPPYPSN